MALKFTWRGKWKNGEIIVEAEGIKELNQAINLLLATGELQGVIGEKESGVPRIPPGQGCSDALRELMKSDWGTQPRSMKEIKSVLDANALYFSKGILSGTLTAMIKRGELRRVKEEGRWKYLHN